MVAYDIPQKPWSLIDSVFFNHAVVLPDILDHALSQLDVMALFEHLDHFPGGELLVFGFLGDQESTDGFIDFDWVLSPPLFAH